MKIPYIILLRGSGGVSRPKRTIAGKVKQGIEFYWRDTKEKFHGGIDI